MQGSGESDGILYVSLYICWMYAYTYICVKNKHHSFDLKLVNATWVNLHA